jgi:hypothetical protein
MFPPDRHSVNPPPVTIGASSPPPMAVYPARTELADLYATHIMEEKMKAIPV